MDVLDGWVGEALWPDHVSCLGAQYDGLQWSETLRSCLQWISMTHWKILWPRFCDVGSKTPPRFVLDGSRKKLFNHQLLEGKLCSSSIWPSKPLFTFFFASQGSFWRTGLKSLKRARTVNLTKRCAPSCYFPSWIDSQSFQLLQSSFKRTLGWLGLPAKSTIGLSVFSEKT